MENEKIDSEYWRWIARSLGDRIAVLTYCRMLGELGTSRGLLALMKWEDEMRVACGELLAKMQSHLESQHRERLAAFMIQHGIATGHGDTTEDLLGELGVEIAKLQGRSDCAHYDCTHCHCWRAGGMCCGCDAVNTMTTDRQRG